MSSYEISTDASRFEMEVIRRELQGAYWAQHRSKEQIEASIAKSLCFGAYDNGRQAGFARVITDYATFAYVCDVFVVSDHRGKGVAQELMKHILNYGALRGVDWLLRTRDAHALYEKFGFSRVQSPGRYMERSR